MTHKEKALELFRQRYHCSQSVIAAFAGDCGLTEKQALKLGACFGGGMRKGEVCGACSGALMVLGSMYGQYDLSDEESRRIANEVNERMMEGFEKACGSCLCKKILGCDISTPEGKQYARENNLFKELCPQFVEKAVNVLEEIIGERQ